MTSQIISNCKANKMLSKGYFYHIVRGNDLEHEIPSIDSVSKMNEFQDVFPKDLPWIPLEREIYFGVDIYPRTKPISFPPYKMALVEIKELKVQLKDLLYKGFIKPRISPWGALVLFVKKKDKPLECLSIIGDSTKSL